MSFLGFGRKPGNPKIQTTKNRLLIGRSCREKNRSCAGDTKKCFGFGQSCTFPAQKYGTQPVIE